MRKLAALVVCAAAAMPAFAATAPTVPTAQLDGPSSSWLGLPASIIAGPDSSVAWPFALGFLGLVVLRRTRSGPMS
jgi:hypothetical protein